MVYFAPDQTFSLLGKNPSQEDIDNIRKQLGYDLPVWQRYGTFLKEIFTFNFGSSSLSHEKITSIFSRTIPISILVALPGFIIGNSLGIACAMWAAFYRGQWQDKIIMIFSAMGMSISLLIVIIAFQLIFCSSYGLNLFPVHGWSANSFFDYLKHVSVPTMATTFVALGYNTRFYRAVIVEEMEKEHVRTARSFGCHPFNLAFKHILKNSLIPILTRIIFTIPYVLVGGSLLIESYFSIPGIGSVTYEAITSGDLPVLKAVISVTTFLYILVLIATDIVYCLIDPRISLQAK